MLGAMPKTKVKRSSTAKSRSSKRSVGTVNKANAANKAKAKTTPRAAKRAKPAQPAKSRGGAIEPRVLAAIGLALEDEANASARADLLSQPVSPWVASGRVRAAKR